MKGLRGEKKAKLHKITSRTNQGNTYIYISLSTAIL